jgi:hypothetical protein
VVRCENLSSRVAESIAESGFFAMGASHVAARSFEDTQAVGAHSTFGNVFIDLPTSLVTSPNPSKRILTDW